MKYEIKIWKDAKKMPDIEPQKAANLLQSVANAVSNAVGAGGNKTNPDILIDQNAGGEDAIQSVDISYITKDVDKHPFWVNQPLPQAINGKGENIPQPPPNVPQLAQIPMTTKSRLIKLHIKGNLYLPLDGGLTDDAKRIAGVGKTQGAENKLRDTLLLSQWASVPPEKDLSDHFYRGIVINIITKAGDFRVITAKKVYVESYVENYNEGEFGTFDLVLVESADFDNKVTVKGLGYEKPSLLDKVKKGIATTAKVVAAVGTTAAVVGTVGKTVTETVEKFTGETTATRWVKYGFDTASSAGSVAGSTSNIMKNPKDPNTWAKETTNINKNVNERIQKGVDTKEDIPLAKMESMYLAAIQKDPAKYEDYLKASQEEKYNMLKDASKAMRDRAAITKDMEMAERDYYKNENEKERADKETKFQTLKGIHNKSLKPIQDIQQQINQDAENAKKSAEDAAKKQNETPTPSTDNPTPPADNPAPSTNNPTNSSAQNNGKGDLNNMINNAANKKNGNSNGTN